MFLQTSSYLKTKSKYYLPL